MVEEKAVCISHFENYKYIHLGDEIETIPLKSAANKETRLADKNMYFLT